eukprot:8843270-Alexandrium_andersonii.AAC.1
MDDVRASARGVVREINARIHYGHVENWGQNLDSDEATRMEGYAKSVMGGLPTMEVAMDEYFATSRTVQLVQAQ